MNSLLSYRYLFFILLLSLAMVHAPNPAHAQVVDEEEDPFQNDPFFTKPIEDMLSPASFRESLRKQRDRILARGGVDAENRDMLGYNDFPGLSVLTPNLQNVRFNRVDGLTLGFRVDQLNWSQHREVRPFGFADYSFARKRFNYGIGIERVFGSEKKLKLGVEYHNTTDSDDQWRLGRTENSLFSIVSGYDFMDYYNRQGFGAYLVYRQSVWFDHTLAFRVDEHTSLEANTRFSLFGGKSHVRSNPAISEGRYQSFIYTLRYNNSNYLQFDGFSLSGDIYMQLSDFDNFATDYRHNRYEAELRSHIRIDKWSALRLRARAGSVTGGQIPRTFDLGGVGSLRARPFKSLTGDRLLLGNVELLMGNWQAHERWKDEWFDTGRVYYSLFADFGWVNGHVDPRKNPFSGFGSFDAAEVATDLGVSVNFSVVRFELAWQASDILGTPVFWVRLNPVF